MKRRFRPLYWIRYYVIATLYRFVIAIMTPIRGMEAIQASLLVQGFEWRACKRCKQYHAFNIDVNATYCDWCEEVMVFYKCIECDRRIWVDSKKKVKVFEGMFCEFCLPDAPDHIIEANQMLIDFNIVKGYDADHYEEYDEIHDRHKQEYQKNKNNIPPADAQIPKSFYSPTEISPNSPDMTEMIRRASQGKFFVKTTTLDDLVGENYNAIPIHIKHADLERVDSDSPHKSMCPVCKKGFLLMQRHQDTLLLTNYDCCILCAQRFEYTDIPDNKLVSL